MQKNIRYTGAPAPSIWAIIPARSGSKGVPEKNIRPLGGHPLLAWSIIAARQASLIERVIVSTDSRDYAAIAKHYGAEAPFLRPAGFAGDNSPDRDFFRHALAWFENEKQDIPVHWVHLRPTTPLRDPLIIDEAIRLFLANPEATSLRSAHEAAESPAKWFGLNEDGSFTGLMGNQWLNRPRQQCPKAYIPNGYVDIVRSRCIVSAEDMYLPYMLGFVSPPVREVDTPEDLDFLDYEVRKGHPLLDTLARIRS